MIREHMKKILLIGTGGTIASRQTGEGLAPQLTAKEMLQYVPQLETLCHADAMDLFKVDSTHMNHTHWCRLAECIRQNYDAYDGFVIAHGTDTMAYTAAALSYLVQGSKKPVVLTGSQKPIGLRETDAASNLADAFLYASGNGACGVHLVFDGQVILGTRARKTRSKSYNSFSSIDFPEVARIRDGHIICFVCEQAEADTPRFYCRMEPGVFVLKLVPGLRAGIIETLKRDYRALIIESFGVGGIPGGDDDGFLAALEDWTASGRTLVMSTQVPHEGVDLDLYEVGSLVKRRTQALEARDMTLEATVTKLMWILAQTQDRARIAQMFYTPVQKDMLLPPENSGSDK